MKKFLLCSLLFFTNYQMALADIAPDISTIERCLTFVNLGSFPDLKFILISDGIFGEDCSPKEGRLIEPGKCMKSPDYCSTSVFYVSKDKFSSLDLKNLKHAEIKEKGVFNDYKYTDLMAINGSLSKDRASGSQGKVKVTEELSIHKNAQGNFEIYASKIITKFNNKPDTIAVGEPGSSAAFREARRELLHKKP